MGGLEALLTGVRDVFSLEMKAFKHSRELLTLAVVTISFLLALSNITNVSWPSVVGHGLWVLLMFLDLEKIIGLG